jgi:hypothetical protein
MPGKPSEPSGAADPLRNLLDEKNLAEEISKAIEGNDCPAGKDLVSYVKKELGEAERIEVKSHLLFCAHCREKVDLLEREIPTGVLKGAPAGGRSFRGFRLPPEEPRKTPLLKRKAVFIALAAVLAAGGFFIARMCRESDSLVRVVQAKEGKPLLRGEQVFLLVQTPQPLYIVQITIDGNGQITSRVPSGGVGGKFSHGDRIPLTPEAIGELDIYLVPWPVSQGSPDTVMGELLKFVKTESSLNRDNQRKGIELALSLYRVPFIHQIYLVDP